MVSSPRRIRVSNSVYDELDKVRHEYNITFSQVIEKYLPSFQFFADVHAKLPPVVKVKVNKAIPKKKKFNYEAELEEFRRTRCKSLSLEPIPLDKRVTVINGEYDDKTKACIAESEANKPWMKKYRGKKS